MVAGKDRRMVEKLLGGCAWKEVEEEERIEEEEVVEGWLTELIRTHDGGTWALVVLSIAQRCSGC